MSKKEKNPKKKKKRPRRSQAKNPALQKQYTSRIRKEYLDYDYLDKLSEEELEWLNRFTEEEQNAYFQHQGEMLNKTKEEKRKCYNRNNARNRCVYSRAKAQNKVVDKESWFFDFNTNKEDKTKLSYNIEDDLIEKLDKKRKKD